MNSSVLNFVIEKALQSTCLSINGCEILLLHKLQYLNKVRKERKCLFVVKRFWNISSLGKEFQNLETDKADLRPLRATVRKYRPLSGKS